MTSYLYTRMWHNTIRPYHGSKKAGWFGDGLLFLVVAPWYRYATIDNQSWFWEPDKR